MMQEPRYCKNGDLKHSDNCKMSFGRKDSTCPRCIELLNGAAPRADYANRKFRAEQEANQLRAIREHDCSKSHCGIVCTFGEW